MNEIPLGVETFVLFFGIFSLVAIPLVFIIYFVNLWLNKRDPNREIRRYARPISKIEKWIRSFAGFLMIILGVIQALWPFYAIFILKEPEYLKGINFSDNIFILIFKMKQFFVLPLLLVSAGIFYIKTSRKGFRKKLTSEEISL
ncbi:MAG: hypothetical protein ABIK92_16415 [Pseudomonadota bacterium]